MKKSRRSVPEIPDVPPVLPVMRMVVYEDGSMQVSIDGVPYLPPEYSPGWRRESFPRIIEAVTQQRSSGVRVEVTEAGGKELMRIEAFEPVSENPVFTLDLPPARAAGPIVVSGRDNNGNAINARIAP